MKNFIKFDRYSFTVLLITLCVFMTSTLVNPQYVQATNSWSYSANSFEDLQDGSFDNIIWDDETRRIQLQGKTLYEDFSMYDDYEDMYEQGWTIGGLHEKENTASIIKRGSNHQLHLDRPEYYIDNLGAVRSFSPTRRGEVEFVFTPISEASRVALYHHPRVELQNGNMSSQFMFRFQKTNGRNRIVYGTNQGYAILGKEYGSIYDAFEYGEEQHIKMTWDLDKEPGVSVYLNGRLVVDNFYSDFITDDFYFHSVELAVGSGGRPIAGQIGEATYSFVSLQQNFNLNGTYTSEPISVQVPEAQILKQPMKISWNQHLVSGSTIQVQTRVSKNGGASWNAWSVVGEDGRIRGLDRGVVVDNNTSIQYRVIMTSNNNNTSPWLNKIHIEADFINMDSVLTVSSNTNNWTRGNVVLTASTSFGEYIVLPNGDVVKGNRVSYTATQNGSYTFKALDSNRETLDISTYVVSNIDRIGKDGVILPNEGNWHNKNIQVQIRPNNNVEK